MKEVINVKRLFSLLLILAMLCGMTALAEETPALEQIDIRLMIDGKPAHPTNSEGDTFKAWLIDGVLYLPAGLIPSGLNLAVSFDDETKTLYVGKQPDVQAGPHWHMISATYELHDGNSNREHYYQQYTYEGELEGKIIFKNVGGFEDKPYNSWSRVVYYECSVPATDLHEGDLLQMETVIRVRDASKGSKVDYFDTGYALVYADLVKGVQQMTDRDGRETNAAAVDKSVGMARANGDWTVIFEGEVFNGLVPGTKAKIEFWCEAGTFTWEYEYVVPEENKKE